MQREISEALQLEMEEMDKFVGEEGQRGRSWGKGDVITSSRG
jgi:hypothetical protein